jgi:adenylate cyclase
MVTGADLHEFRNDVEEEVSSILASDFTIDVTDTSVVPHSSDPAITFPNLDAKTQGAKLITTTVLYVDMRQSTALSMTHQKHTLAKLYSAFVRAMTRCAFLHGGELRGIIGDRVMMLFDSRDCFAQAVDTAVLANSVCQYVINRHFRRDEVAFGIGIDYGSMLATKTGIRRHGAAQQSYRSLVWLGRPANVASRLTDEANKPEQTTYLTKVNVAYQHGFLAPLTYVEEWPHQFVQNFTYDPSRHLMVPTNPAFHSFTTLTKRIVTRVATPPILMTKGVYDGFAAKRPYEPSIQNGWFKRVNITIPECTDHIYGGDVIYTLFRDG